jgi:hypothetical protein
MFVVFPKTERRLTGIPYLYFITKIVDILSPDGARIGTPEGADGALRYVPVVGSSRISRGLPPIVAHARAVDASPPPENTERYWFYV